MHLLGVRIHALVHLLTYLLTYTVGSDCAYKTVNISETVEDGAKVTINGLYKINRTRPHGLSIAAKILNYLESSL